MTLLDRLDQEAEAVGTPAPGARLYQRASYRWPYRVDDIAVTVGEPAGGIRRAIVFGRNLSALGMSFVHRGSIHPGSTCRIMLPRVDGEFDELWATAVSCRLVDEGIHEIGVVFQTPIDPKPYLRAVSDDDGLG